MSSVLYPPEDRKELHDAFPDRYPAPTPAEALLAAEKEIRSRYALLMAGVAHPYTPTERETWFLQTTEADAYLQGSGTPPPMIAAMALARGIPVELLVAKIKENDRAFRTAIGGLLGQQQAELDALGR